MKRPLMPGSEPVQVRYKPAEPEPVQVQVTGRLDSSGGALNGCDCEMCMQLRRGAQPYVAPPSFQNIPRGGAPRPGLIRGQYDFTQGRTDRELTGRVRWLDPSTGQVYDEQDHPQWTFQNVDGEWLDVPRRDRGDGLYRWRPAAEPSAVFDWGSSISSAMAEMLSTPPAPVPVGPNAGRLRGRYDPSTTGGVFRGDVRWLDQSEGRLYDDDGECTNTISFDGQHWVTGGGLRWEPL